MEVLQDDFGLEHKGFSDNYCANMKSFATFVVAAITWAVASQILLSTAPLMMGSGTESKLWGELKKNPKNKTHEYRTIKTYLALLWGDCSPFSEHSRSKEVNWSPQGWPVREVDSGWLWSKNRQVTRKDAATQYQRTLICWFVVFTSIPKYC